MEIVGFSGRYVPEAGSTTAPVLNETIRKQLALREDFLKSKADLISTYQAAAAKGDLDAMIQLGKLHFKAADVSGYRDRSEGTRWYQRAAEEGSLEAQLYLGDSLNHTGSRFSDDQYTFIQSARWYKMAAEQGHVEAAYKLGRVIIQYQDPYNARKWFLQAAQGGHTWGMFYLAMNYHDQLDPDYIEAVEWIQRVIASDDVEASSSAQCVLGTWYERGDGVVQDASAAVRMYQQAMGRGCERAMMRLGSLYLKGGKNLEKDVNTGIRYLKEAADKNCFEAAAELGLRYMDGQDGLEIDKAEAQKYFEIAGQIRQKKSVRG